LRRHAIVGGATGSGKSGGLNELLANLAACQDVVIWAIDLKRGVELRPWAPCIDRLATTPTEAAALLADAVTVLFARAQWLADHGRGEWEPSPARPALVIIIDEYAELAGDAPDTMSDTDTIARLGRAPAVTLVAATQRPTQKVMGQAAGYAYLHHAVDDHSRLAYSEILDDERKETAAAFWEAGCSPLRPARSTTPGTSPAAARPASRIACCSVGTTITWRSTGRAGPSS
jgi:hypothetical protein